LVFEKIWELSASYEIADYDAINEKRYEQAYRALPAQEDAVIAALPDHAAVDIRRAVTDLVNKSIIERTATGALKVVF